MAIDSRDKRSSAIETALPTRGMYPVADGAFNQADRQHALGIYRGIAAISNVEINSTLFTNTSTFGTAVVSTNYSINAVIFTNANTFGTSVIASSDGSITGVKFTNVNTFGAAVVTTTYDITGVLFTNISIFGSHLVGAPPYEITGTLFTNMNTFGNAFVFQPGVGDSYSIKARRDGYHIKAYGS